MIWYVNLINRLWQLKEQGKEFFHQKFYTVNNNTSINFLIDYTQHTSGQQKINLETPCK